MSAAGTAAWLALRLRHTKAKLEQVERKSEGLSSYLSDRRKTPGLSMAAIPAPRSAAATASTPAAPAERVGSAPAHAGLITAHLAELCDRLGAAELVLWRTQSDGSVGAAAWSAGAGAIPAVAGSTGIDLNGLRPDVVPPCFRFDKWMSMVEWAGQQHLLQCERLDEGGRPPTGGDAWPREQPAAAITFAVAPVADEVRGYCALSASALAGTRLRGTEQEIRAALARGAQYIAELADLVHTQVQSDRRVRWANVLVNSAKMLQSKRSTDNLAEAICRDVMQITGAARAALVKWDGGARAGFVLSATPTQWVAAGQRVLVDSRVGECCAEDQPRVWEDARQLDRSTPMFGSEESVPAVGSLLVVPMTQEQRVVGAIVVAGNGVGEVVASDIDPLRMVATIATASLDRLADLETARLVSKTDELTGLSNRRHFDDQLVRLVGEAERRRQPVSLIVLDVDHFKRVNDSYGHEAGDAVLRSIARSVENGVRAVANGDLCARYGGEELAVLLPGVPGMEAMEIAERLRRAISAKGVMYHGKRINVTASFGVASYPDSARTHATLFPAADRALYQAKSDGRNLVKSASVSDSRAATSTEPPRSKLAAR